MRFFSPSHASENDNVLGGKRRRLQSRFSARLFSPCARARARTRERYPCGDSREETRDQPNPPPYGDTTMHLACVSDGRHEECRRTGSCGMTSSSHFTVLTLLSSHARKENRGKKRRKKKNERRDPDARSTMNPSVRGGR